MWGDGRCGCASGGGEISSAAPFPRKMDFALDPGPKNWLATEGVGTWSYILP